MATEPPFAARPLPLALLVALQATAVSFFLVDIARDLKDEPWGPHLVAEALAVVALLAGLAFGLATLRRLLADRRRQQAALEVARGALAEVVTARFAEWRLTPAEADVAWFALKGLDAAEIARARGAAAGTVRAQLAQVYAKAGVGSRSELLSLFLDELIDGLPAG